MKIEHVTTSTDELFRALQTLTPQLTANHPPPSRADMDALIAAPGSITLIARHPDETGPIVGAASLVVYRVLTGIRAHLEDVVVDTSARGLGIGEALTREALRIAKDSGADGVALTSNPLRVAANKLYQKIGFKRRETNLYFYKFE
jgi:ribosomal protein S18 acetylase RimI-like enzyme